MTSQTAQGLAWIGATTVGLAAGGFVFHFPGSIGGQVDWSLSAGLFGLILGVMTGAAAGVLQWAALLLPRRTGSRLVLAMALVIGVNHALLDASPFLVSHALMAIVAGLATAAVFAWRLAERDPRVFVASAVAWSIGLIAADLLSDSIGLPFEETPIGWSTDHAFDGLVVGLVWGGTTALAGIAARLRGGSTAGLRQAEAHS
jgi:hypothetical protein